MAEVHARDTDIIYVLEGSATIVTGGQVVDGKTTATDEIRGRVDHGRHRAPSGQGGRLHRPQRSTALVYRGSSAVPVLRRQNDECRPEVHDEDATPRSRLGTLPCLWIAGSHVRPARSMPCGKPPTDGQMPSSTFAPRKVPISFAVNGDTPTRD